MAREIVVAFGISRIYWGLLYDGLKISIPSQDDAAHANNQQVPLGVHSTPAKAKHAVLLGKIRRLYSKEKKKDGVGLDFLTLVERFSYAEASIDLDKLFALVGLALDTDYDVFDPDYTLSLGTVVRRYQLVDPRGGGRFGRKQGRCTERSSNFIRPI